MGKIIPEFDLCSGCEICMLSCCEENHEGYNPRYARLRIEHMKNEIFVEPIVCNQCVNAACEKVCPVQAISKKLIYIKNEGPEGGSEEGSKENPIKYNKTRIVTIDQAKCTGCGTCQEYCPRGVIVIIDKKAYKCDLCQGEPVCIKNCPKGALKFHHEGVEIDAFAGTR